MLSMKRLQIPVDGTLVSRNTVHEFTSSSTFDALFVMKNPVLIAGGQGHGGNVNKGVGTHVAGRRGAAGDDTQPLFTGYIQGEVIITIGEAGANGTTVLHELGPNFTEADSGSVGGSTVFNSDALFQSAIGTYGVDRGDGAWYEAQSDPTDESSWTYGGAISGFGGYAKGGYQTLAGSTYTSYDADDGIILAEILD